MTCNIFAKNGNESVLFKNLETDLGDNTAREYYAIAHTDLFRKVFGDWINNPGTFKLDSNNEPLVKDVKDIVKRISKEFLVEKENKEQRIETIFRASFVNKNINFVKDKFEINESSIEIPNSFSTNNILESISGLSEDEKKKIIELNTESISDSEKIARYLSEIELPFSVLTHIKNTFNINDEEVISLVNNLYSNTINFPNVEQLVKQQSLSKELEAVANMHRALIKKVTQLKKRQLSANEPEKYNKLIDRLDDLSVLLSVNTGKENILKVILDIEREMQVLSKSFDRHIKEIKDFPATNDAAKYDFMKEKMMDIDYLLDYANVFKRTGELFELLKDGEEFNTNWFNEHIAPTLTTISEIQKSYKTLALDLTVEFLDEQNDNSNLTKDGIRSMLQLATEDIGFFNEKLDSLAEVPDPILALVDRAIKEKKFKVYTKVNKFKNTILKKAYDNLVEFQRSQGIDVINNEKLYDFMLMKDANGVFDGQYLTHTELKKIYNEKDPRVEFAKVFSTYIEGARTKINSKDTGYIPLILKSEFEIAKEDVKGLKSLKTAVGKTIKRALTTDQDDTMYGEEVMTDNEGNEFRFVPTHFNGTKHLITKEDLDPNHLSLDLASNLIKYLTMAENHYEMLNILPEIEAVKYLVKEREVEINKIEQGSSLRDLMNKKILGTGQKVRVPGITSNSYKMLNDHINTKVYGEYNIDAGVIFGNIDVQKATDQLMGYTSILNLSLNALSGINNIVIGNIFNGVEGSGGRFYNHKEFRSSFKEYTKLIPSFLKDYSKRFPESKIGLFMDTFNMNQSFDEFGNKLSGTSLSQKIVGDATFFLQTSGEHMIQTTHMISHLQAHRIIKGEALTYYEFLGTKTPTKENRKEFESFPTAYESIEDDGISIKGMTKDEVFKLTERIKGHYQYVHGNYAKLDKISLNKVWYGKLIMLFRKWLRPGWNRRFKAMNFGKDEFGIPMETFDYRLGLEQSGNYMITLDFIKKLYKEAKQSQLNILNLSKSNSWRNLPSWKKAEVKKTIAEMNRMLAMTLIAAFLSGLDDEDEDQRSWILNTTSYLATRASKELRFFNFSIEDKWDILQSPAASISVFEKFGEVLEQLYNPEFYEIGEDKGDWKGWNKIQKFIPYWHNIEKLIDIEESRKWMN